MGTFAVGYQRRSGVFAGSILEPGAETQEHPQMRHAAHEEHQSRPQVSFIDVGKMASILNSGLGGGSDLIPEQLDGMQDSSARPLNFVPLWIRIVYDPVLHFSAIELVSTVDYLSLYDIDLPLF
jgi:hypothetical protein